MAAPRASEMWVPASSMMSWETLTPKPVREMRLTATWTQLIMTISQASAVRMARK